MWIKINIMLKCWNILFNLPLNSALKNSWITTQLFIEYTNPALTGNAVYYLIQ